MKKIMFIMIILSLVFCLYAQKTIQKYIEYDLGYDNFKFDEKKCYYENITGLTVGSYFYPQNLTFELNMDSPYIHAFDSQSKKEALIIKNEDLCIVYYTDENRNINYPFFIGIEENSNKRILNGQSIKSSSNFVEKGKEYSPDKLFSLILNNPWVENSSDYGIGEYLEFDLAGFSGERYLKATGFYIINGFVSISNQSLYEKNTRIKTIKIVDLKTKEEWIQELEDTPNPQFIDCKGHEGNSIRIIIQDVYPGTLWKDTCISGIVLAK